MPELPEVESIRRSTAKHTIGKTILDVKVLWPPVAITYQDWDFYELLKNQMIEYINRRGKYLLMDLSNGITLVIHFRMTGRLTYYAERKPVEKHTHLVLYLNEGEVHYSDPRKFGRVQLIPTNKLGELNSLAKLGPEPLDDFFTFNVLGSRLVRKKTNIKATLLDQTIVAGLGNIYADEALFHAGVLPTRMTSSLKASEVILLHDAICGVLSKGVESKGTSFRDYRDANGDKGSFQENLMVYGRAGQPCKVCGEILNKQKIAGRTTVYCTCCQH